jgi:hypothetical protein
VAVARITNVLRFEAPVPLSAEMVTRLALRTLVLSYTDIDSSDAHIDPVTSIDKPHAAGEGDVRNVIDVSDRYPEDPSRPTNADKTNAKPPFAAAATMVGVVLLRLMVLLVVVL